MSTQSETPTITGREPSLEETIVGAEGPRRKTALARLARGTTIGRYIVLERLGIGGMGVVYEAYDPELDRKVAVKLLRTGPEGPSKAGAVRLLGEAQAMAALSHPNVVTVHDVGTHEGDVFVAMELIDGWTLRKWLEQSPRPGLGEILEVFRAAAQGLAAAHAVGMVHRDFKPDNVMIGRDGRVRVMDFGLARRTEEAEAEPTTGGQRLPSIGERLTVTGARMGTPAYMSPEQHAGEATDARSDQFSYCITLFEAIYGQRPYGGESPLNVAVRLHQGELPDVPSDVVVPGWLHRMMLRGLALDPADRFADMEALRAELDRDRRSPWRRIGLSLGGAAVVGGLAWSVGHSEEPTPCSAGPARVAEVWDDGRAAAIEEAFAATARPYAEQTWTRLRPRVDDYARRWQEGYRDACEATTVRGEQSEGLLDLRMICLRERLEGLRGVVTAYADVDADSTQALEHADALLDDLPEIAECADLAGLTAPVDLPGDPERREQVAELREGLARVRTLASQGRYAEGVELAAEATERARVLTHAPTTADALVTLGRLQHLAGQHEAAEQSLLEAVEVAARGRHDAAAAEAWVELVAVVGAEQARAREGELLARVAAAANERSGAGAREQAELAVAWAGVLEVSARYDEARQQLERAMALREGELGPQHPKVAEVLVALGDIARQQGRYADATERYREARTILVGTLGEQHPEVARAYNSLGNVAFRAGRFDEAAQLHRKALTIREASLGPRHPDVAASLNNLAAAHEQQGDDDESLALNLRSLEIRREALGPSHPKVAMSLNNIGNVYVHQGRLQEGIEHLEQALAIRTEVLGPEHPAVAETLGNLASAHQTAKQWDEALDYDRRALALFERSLGPEHPNVAAARLTLAWLSNQRGDPDTAEVEAQRALEILRPALGEEHRLVGLAYQRLGSANVLQGRDEVGLEHLRHALRIFDAIESVADVVALRFTLLRYAWSLGEREEAEAQARALLEEWGGRAEAAEVLEQVRTWLATDPEARGTED